MPKIKYSKKWAVFLTKKVIVFTKYCCFSVEKSANLLKKAAIILLTIPPLNFDDCTAGWADITKINAAQSIRNTKQTVLIFFMFDISEEQWVRINPTTVFKHTKMQVIAR